MAEQIIKGNKEKIIALDLQQQVMSIRIRVTQLLFFFTLAFLV